MNEALYRRVLEQIKTHPETWDQTLWHGDCGTEHCFAGWVDVLIGNQSFDLPTVKSIRDLKNRATEALGLDRDSKAQDWLFHPLREIKDFERYLEDLEFRSRIDDGLL